MKNIKIFLKYSIYLILFKLTGWRISAIPALHNMSMSVYIATEVPHTSFYDFYISLLVAKIDNYHRELQGMPTQKTVIMVAKEHANLPIVRHLHDLLCIIPVDRKNPKNNISVIKRIKKYMKEGNVRILIAPEATRSATPVWDSGFYNLAKLNKLPIYPCGLDYSTKTFVGLGFFELTKDTEYDKFYEALHKSFPKHFAKNPERYLSYEECVLALEIENDLLKDAA